MRKLSLVLCYLGKGDHVIHGVDEFSIFSLERVNHVIERVKQKQDPVTIITGKIYPSFKHNPDKIKILVRLVELYDHYKLDAQQLTAPARKILSPLEEEYFSELVQQTRDATDLVAYIAAEIRREIDKEVLKIIYQSK